MKLIFLIILLVSCLLFFLNNIDHETVQETSVDSLNLYSGPVPLGADMEYFRKTGITRMEEVG